MTNENRPLILQAKDIKKAFYTPSKVDILKGIDLTAYQGDSIAITGRSGEGKSTLLQILGTLETPCSGLLEICNTKVSLFNKSKLRNSRIGFIFQFFHLLEDYTALENILMPARIARQNTKKGSEHYQKAMDLLEKVGLSDRAHFNTKLLSGGEKQRVALARAMCNDPDLILADEPSGNLDSHTSSHIHELLLNFVNNSSKTLIVVTHDNNLAKLCSHHYNLQNGLLVKTT